MDNDIVPELLEKVKSEFNLRLEKSSKIKALKEMKKNYKQANEYAIEVGQILADTLNSNITSDILPDGKMYFNIADRILRDTMGNNYQLVADYTKDVQQYLNKQANIGLKTKIPELNEDRIDGIINRISNEPIFDEVSWIISEPIINFSQNVVDDFIESNAKFHEDAGLNPKITRSLYGDACDWCKSLAGTYDYHKAPKDIYRRHDRCRCIVEYDPKDGRGVQNSHSKEWRRSQKDAKIKVRKEIGLRKPDIQLPKSVSAKAKDIFAKHDIPIRGETAIKGGSVIKKVNIIGGKGVNRPIDDINRLVRENPGSKAEDWQKVTGIAEMGNGKKAEVHWYQARNIGKIEFKVKRWL